jgi:hypothetical protein
MIVLRYETHTHSKTYRFNELTESIKFTNFGDRLCKIKELMALYAQSRDTDPNANDPRPAAGRRNARTVSPHHFIKWLGVHWASVSKMPGVKQAEVTHFLQL